MVDNNAEYKNQIMINIPKTISLLLKQPNKLDVDDKLYEVKYNGQSNTDYTLSTLKVISNLTKKTIQEIKDLFMSNLSNMITSNNTDVHLDMISCEYINIYLNFNLNKLWMIDKISRIPNNNIYELNHSPETILVDFSSPNISKDMHIGHFRSTVLGNCISNLFKKLGHNVLNINHIGDYGLPIGMIIQYVIDNNSTLEDLQSIYRSAKFHYDKDVNDFKNKAHDRTVKLQCEDIETTNIWKNICALSRRQYNEIYDRLNIKLEEVGESFYGSKIAGLIDELENKNLLIQDENRKVVICNKNIPFTVIKSDGGYTYGTTDLAAIRYRLCELKVNRIYYVVGSEQRDHFIQVIEIAKKAGWLQDQIVVHVDFGLIFDEKGKRLRSRDGDTEKLIDLLNEGIKKADPKLIYNSMKYFDLQHMRKNNYCFSYDKMLDFKGKTATYLSYTYARVCNVIKFADINTKFKESAKMNINDLLDEDFEIMKIILRMPEIITQVQNDLYPSDLCMYLHQLCNIINVNYKKCRCVSDIDGHKIFNYSRYVIFTAIKKILNEIFEILGMDSIENM